MTFICARSFVLAGFLLLAVPSFMFAQTQQGIWINSKELSNIPMSGPAWDALKRAADSEAGSPDISNQTQSNNVLILAKALVFARTGIQQYRTQVIDHVMRAIGTEQGGRTLALGRNLFAYVVAAELVGLPAAQNQTFRTWLRSMLTVQLEGRTLQSTHNDRPNNWGTHAGASRLAVAAYLGDWAEFDRAAAVFKGWTGDRSAYAGFKFGDYLDGVPPAQSWQCDLSKPVGINPRGCVKNGRSIDGVLADDQRRAGSFTWPPPKENYVWEALQGALVQAEILHRFGYDAYNWSDKALLRAVEWLYRQAAYPAEGDDTWQPHVLNYRYGNRYPAPIPSRPGKNVGWTEWTHGSGRTNSPPMIIHPGAKPADGSSSSTSVTVTPGSTNGPPPSTTVTVTPGSKPPDSSGNGTPAAPPEPPSFTVRVEQDDPAVRYNNVWYTHKSSRHSGGASSRALDAGASVTFEFTGTAVSWIARRDEWSGIASVYIDGALRGDVDTYSSVSLNNAMTLHITNLPFGKHTITIEATGRKHASSSGRWIWVDGFEYSTPNTPPPPPAPAAAGQRGFSEGANTAALNGRASIQSGYGQISRNGNAAAPPGGIAIVGLEQDGVLIDESAVTASGRIEAGRIPVEQSGNIVTGLAIANPNDQPNTIHFYFTDVNGRDSASGQLTIPPRGQLSRFMNEDPFNMPEMKNGALTFHASLPVSAAAIRGVLNERPELVMTSIPVADLAAASEDPVTIPHYADGGGWQTELLLVNPTNRIIRGHVVLGQNSINFDYVIPPRASRSFRTAGTAAAARSGAIHVTPAGADKAPLAVAIVSHLVNGVTVSTAGVPGMQAGSSFQAYVEATGKLGDGRPQSTESAVALANSSNDPIVVTLDLADRSGRVVASSTLTIPGNGHQAPFLSQISGFGNLPAGFKGVLRASSNAPGLSMTGLRARVNQRGELLIASSGALDESSVHPNAELLFPYVAFGGGYGTSFVLFNNREGTAADMRLYSGTGASMQ